VKIVRAPIPLAELSAMAEATFGDFVKAVVDVGRGVMAIDAGLHSDEEQALLEDGSKQDDLWGVNLYPAVAGDDWVEFDSMINIRPWQGNRGRGVDSPDARAAIVAVLERLVAR
jgi:hypothetical protein